MTTQMLAGPSGPDTNTVTDLLLGLAGDARRWQQALLTAYRALTQETAAGGRAAEDQMHGFDVVHGAGPADHAVRDLLAAARNAAVWIRQPATGDSRVAGIVAGLDRTPAGGTLRALVDAGPQHTGAVLDRMPPGDGVEVRIAGTRTAAGPGRHDAVVLDGSVLALLSGHHEREPHTIVISQAGAVDLVQSLFDTAWSHALPARPGAAGRLLPDGDLRHQIVRRLAEGGKDEAIARSLGVSLRTCRRHIAEILADAGAVSRFQAGYLLGRDSYPGAPQ